VKQVYLKIDYDFWFFLDKKFLWIDRWRCGIREMARTDCVISLCS